MKPKKPDEILREQLLARGCTDEHIHVAAFSCAIAAMYKYYNQAIEEAAVIVAPDERNEILKLKK